MTGPGIPVRQGGEDVNSQSPSHKVGEREVLVDATTGEHLGFLVLREDWHYSLLGVEGGDMPYPYPS